MSILKIDIDYNPPEGWLNLWEVTRVSMLKELGFHVKRMTRHPSTKGNHYFIEIDKELADDTVNMFQFLLGDDHTRVKINQWRIERGIEHWNKIFDRKLFKKKAKTITCFYCGNIIPLIGDKK